MYTNIIDESLDFLKENTKGKRATLSFSHQNEDVIIIDLLQIAGIEFDTFTLDTHKLFEESKKYQKAVEEFFDIEIKSYSAPDSEIKTLEASVGEFGIFDSVEKRKECCRVRKLVPLKEALNGFDIWITGIRATQSATRKEFTFTEIDKKYNIVKLNPLVKWGSKDITKYMKMRKLPQNELYSKKFTSIGCAPCTRPIEKGEDERAGRWWWENPEHKECGLHKR
ncbi:MAG: hypothetical protein RL154_1474 [Pseudomonadota bacterium]